MRLLQLVREALKSLFPSSETFRIEEVRVSVPMTPLWECIVTHGKGKRQYSRTHMIEARSPADAVDEVMKCVPAGCTIGIDGQRWRWNEGAARPYPIDPAHRAGKGDRARWRGEPR